MTVDTHIRLARLKMGVTNSTEDQDYQKQRRDMYQHQITQCILPHKTTQVQHWYSDKRRMTRHVRNFEGISYQGQDWIVSGIRSDSV